jgi:hypothetical protein
VDNSEIFKALADRVEVLGGCLCGSHRMGLADRYADVDVWVFVDPATPLSDTYCLERLIPPELALELLSEGRDDSRVAFSVYNALTDDGILNLKFCSLDLLTAFVKATPTFDQRYLEDLENYQTMQVLWEREDIISVHQRVLRQRVVPRFLPTLAGEWVGRYASAYWRSVFQGFLRQDTHSWRLLMSDMIMYLADVSHVKNGRVPTPRKWALAQAVLNGLDHGVALARCLNAVAGCQVTDRHQVAACYHALGAAEEEILDTAALARGFWWRSVFVERLRNLDLPEVIIKAATGVPRPPRLARR